VKDTDEAHDGYVAERKQARSHVCQEKELVVMKESVMPTGLVMQLASKYDSLHDHKEQLQNHKSRSLAPLTNKFFPCTSPKAIEDNFLFKISQPPRKSWAEKILKTSKN